MDTELHRRARLITALRAMRAAVERELGQATAERAVLADEIEQVDAALREHDRFLDLVLVPALKRHAALTERLRRSDARLATLRERRADLLLMEKRFEARAAAMRAAADRRKNRRDLAALTDAAAGRAHASLPQGDPP